MFEIEIDLTDLNDEFGEMLRRLKNPKPLMAGIAQELVAETEKNFTNESGPGGKWEALKVSTIKHRQKTENWPGKILQVKGDLAKSVNGFHSTYEAGVRVGSGPSKKYAAIHQFGGDAGRGHQSKIPARPFLPLILNGGDANLSDSAVDSIVEMTRYFVNGKLI